MRVMKSFAYFVFFFFNDTATTEIYTLSLHDALPISGRHWSISAVIPARAKKACCAWRARTTLKDGDELGIRQDRKSTRLNSSHPVISYAVFCLKKKKTKTSGTARNDAAITSRVTARA